MLLQYFTEPMGDDIPRELTPNVHVCIMPLMVVVLRHVIGRGAARE